MRLPNGYGGITKMPGNRRKPWRVRVTDHWELTDDNKSKQVFKIIGYYATRKEAMNALSSWNSGIAPIKIQNVKFCEVFDAWHESYRGHVRESTWQNYKSTYLIFKSIENRNIASLSLSEYEMLMKESGKAYPTLKHAKSILKLMYKYAYAHGYVTIDQANMISYLDPKHLATSEGIKKPHTIFTNEEIDILWQHKDEYVTQIVLLLIYTGLRINELLENDKSNWHDDYIDITVSKTPAGVRKVPIADKVKPIYYVLRDSKIIKYHQFCDRMKKELPLDTRHRCHDTRHTTATLLTGALVDDRIIKMILGHSAGNITFDVYTHSNMELMREAINKI